MAYTHGVYVYEAPTSLVSPANVDSAVQVAVGISPINLGNAENPTAPQIAYSYGEAVEKLGMSGDLGTYTLSQVIKASFVNSAVAPVVMINVLDPAKHTKEAADISVTLKDGQAVIERAGVLAESVSIVGKQPDPEEEGQTVEVACERDQDYTLFFNSEGHLVIKAVEGGKLAEELSSLRLTCKQLDPSMVEKEDVLEGIARIPEVYPAFGVVPGQLLAPGWSHLPEVYNALVAKSSLLNGMFSALVLADIDTNAASSYEKVGEIKGKNGITAANSAVLWPMCRVGEDIYYASAVAAAHIATTDLSNEGVPYVSPSNKNLGISGLCLADGSEVLLDVEQANSLNSQGVCTAINLNGWRFWGNRTAAYPGSTDIKDTFIPVRRMFLWWGNTFILTYFSKVDDPMNRRLIESVVDSENIRANGFKSRLNIADASINLDPSLTTADLMDGVIRFRQNLTPFPPAETIINTLEFDPSALEQVVVG